MQRLQISPVGHLEPCKNHELRLLSVQLFKAVNCCHLLFVLEHKGFYKMNLFGKGWFSNPVS